MMDGVAGPKGVKGRAWLAALSCGSYVLRCMEPWDGCVCVAGKVARMVVGNRRRG